MVTLLLVVAVVAGGGATMFNEPGPTITATEWGRLVDRVGVSRCREVGGQD